MTIKNNTTNLTALLEQVNNLPDAGGVELPTLSNEGTASDLLSGKQLIDQDGEIVTGTIATKTSSNLTASGATVTVPAGYYATQATKSVTTATQATPSVSIDSAGKITASATQTAGYVTAGTKTGTKQMTVQAATTWTPTTSNQTIASGTYLTGTQTIKGDSNLVAGNIKSGVSIFGVAGSFEGSGGAGGATVETCTVEIDLSGITMSEVYGIYYMQLDSSTQKIEIMPILEIEPLMTLEDVIKGSMICFETAGYVKFSGDCSFSYGDTGTATTVGIYPDFDNISLLGEDAV